MSLFDITLVFFLIMNPIGNLNAYLTLTHGIETKRKSFIVLREMVIALFVMLVFIFLGDTVFEFLGLSEASVKISSGVILFLVALKIIFGSGEGLRSHLQEEPFVVPIAIPLVASPSLLAMIMLYSHLTSLLSQTLPAVLMAWFLSAVIFLCAEQIKRVFKTTGLKALEKVIGLVLILLGVQTICGGIELFWKTQILHA